jgi:hypothetical protein
VRRTLKFFSEKFGLTGSLLHLTDLALCAPLDFTSRVCIKSISLMPHRDLPPYRWRTLLNCSEIKELMGSNNTEGLKDWISLGVRLFGEKASLPYSLIGGCVTPMVSSNSLTPFGPQGMQDYVNHKNMPFVNAIIGNVEKMFDDSYHIYAFVERVMQNHRGYVRGYTEYIWTAWLPHFEFFQDFLCHEGVPFGLKELSAESPREEIAWKQDLNLNMQLARLAPTLASICSGQLSLALQESAELQRQVWDADAYLTNATGLNFTENYVKNQLLRHFSKAGLDWVNFINLP